MSLIRDTEEVIKFLEFAGRKSILNDHAIHNRMTACHNLFGTLNEEEDSLTWILSNLDVLVNRFRNKNSNVQASTLKVYKSRCKSSIEDFQAWSADPFAWERAVTDKAKAAAAQSQRKEKNAPRPSKAARKTRTVKLELPEPMEMTLPLGSSRRVAFPIRKDFCVEMTLPPEGLTLKELQRIGLFLYPYCLDIDPGSDPRTFGH